MNELKDMFPDANIAVLDAISGSKSLFNKYSINTDMRFKMFMAQMAHESGGFKHLTELKYKTKTFEEKYGHETRIGKILGNTKRGDGNKYFGRGIIQLTGRWNYKYYGSLIEEDLVNNPDLAESPYIALEIAVLYWKKKNLNELSDIGDVRTVTKLINGGTRGLSSRMHWYRKLVNISLSILEH